jgi:hypothetical protein
MPLVVGADRVQRRLRGLSLEGGVADPSVRIPDTLRIRTLRDRVSAVRAPFALPAMLLEPEITFRLRQTVPLPETDPQLAADRQDSLDLGPVE